MKIRILGSGTSTGVPQIGCTCEVCTSADPRDRRWRTSALVYSDDARILVDCGPDFREQMLRVEPFEPIHALLLTHHHYDHTGGIDDLRPYCHFGTIPIYANAATVSHLQQCVPYCFAKHKYPGIPRICLLEAKPGEAFSVNRTEVLPILVMHGQMEILGYRIGGRLGYITDMKTMPDESYEQLQGLDLLIINALRPQPHPTHMGFDEAIEAARRIGARETYFVHMSHQAGLHAEIDSRLPEHMHFAYDGLTLTF